MQVWRGVKPPAHLVPSKNRKKTNVFRFFWSKKSVFSIFHYDQGLRGACPVIFVKYGIFQKPTPGARQAGFCVVGKKSWRKSARFVPGPQCRPEPVLARPGAGPAGRHVYFSDELFGF